MNEIETTSSIESIRAIGYKNDHLFLTTPNLGCYQHLKMTKKKQLPKA